MTNNFNYKGFGLYALLEWKNGGDIYNKSAQWLTRDDRHGMMDQFGKPDYLKKTITYYKVFYDVNTQNDFWVEDGSYLKLREFSLSYSLASEPLKGFAKGYIKGIRLALIGKNLYTLTKYSGYDPEVADYQRNPVFLIRLHGISELQVLFCIARTEILTNKIRYYENI